MSGDVLGLPDCAREFVDYSGDVNYMKGGIERANKVTTVSQTYAREILNSYFGYGMNDILVNRQYKLSGIINGIDVKSNDPKTDKNAYANYDLATFDKKVEPETLGFNSDQEVVVQNTIRMNGKADGVQFAEVSHSVQQNFSNHGLVKSSKVDNGQELIQYEVLINPYHLALPESPSLVDTLDKRLQLDTDTLLKCYNKLVTVVANETKEKR